MIAALILATCLIAQPENVDQPDLKVQVEQLLRQLDDRERAKREAAEKQLVELGSDILPHLPEPNNRMAAEMRQRLARIKAALEKISSQQTLEAAKVNLSGEMPLSEAFQAILEQTGNEVTGYENSEITVKTDFQDASFWPALDQLLDQAQLNTDPLGGRPNVLVLASRPAEQQPRAGSAFYEGPFRVDAIRIFSVRDLRNPQVNGMRISTALAWEPRLSPISVSHPFAAAQATDDQGNAIPIASERGGREATIQPGMTGIEIEIPFQLTDRSVKSIASLRGEFTVLVPGESEEFVFDGKLAAGTQQKHAGVTVAIDSIRKNVEVFQIGIRIRFEEAEGALESHRNWIYANEAYLLDPQGERIANAGYESTGRRADEVGVAYLFALPEGQKDLTGCSFVYKTPTSILRHTVGYELKDLPLP